MQTDFSTSIHLVQLECQRQLLSCIVGEFQLRRNVLEDTLSLRNAAEWQHPIRSTPIVCLHASISTTLCLIYHHQMSADGICLGAESWQLLDDQFKPFIFWDEIAFPSVSQCILISWNKEMKDPSCQVLSYRLLWLPRIWLTSWWHHLQLPSPISFCRWVFLNFLS